MEEKPIELRILQIVKEVRPNALWDAIKYTIGGCIAVTIFGFQWFKHHWDATLTVLLILTTSLILFLISRWDSNRRVRRVASLLAEHERQQQEQWQREKAELSRQLEELQSPIA